VDSRVQPNPEVPLNKTAKAPAVMARGLIKRFGRTVALRGVDLEVAEGEGTCWQDITEPVRPPCSGSYWGC